MTISGMGREGSSTTWMGRGLDESTRVPALEGRNHDVQAVLCATVTCAGKPTAETMDCKICGIPWK